MPGTDGATVAEIIAAVEGGALAGEYVDASAARIAALQRRTAIHDASTAFDADTHHALARRAAGASIVLLRNENNVLPLDSDSDVAVQGEFAQKPRYQGGGSSHVNATRVDVPLDELRLALGEGRVHYAPGYGAAGADSTAALVREEAADLARRADISVVFVGLEEKEESEGFDRTHLDLPADHVALIRAVAAASPRTVVVLSNGGVVTLEP
jgi:beta-glucosidase